jgi:hypothetical protein
LILIKKDKMQSSSNPLYRQTSSTTNNRQSY